MENYASAVPRAFGRRLKIVQAMFSVNGSGAPSIVSHANLTEAGLSAAVRSAAGKYLFTLSDRYAECVYAGAHYLAAGDAEDLYAQAALPANLGSATNAVTFTVRTKTGSTNTDPAAAVNHLSILLVFEDMPTV